MFMVGYLDYKLLVILLVLYFCVDCGEVVVMVVWCLREFVVFEIYVGCVVYGCFVY